MSADVRQVDDLMQCAARGDEAALDALISRYRGRLTRMVQAYLNPQLQGRVDASDVVQEALLEAARRLEEYLKDPQAPFFLWMRRIVQQKLIDVHRQHLGAAKRDATREVPLYQGTSEVASDALAMNRWGQSVRPSQVAVRTERWVRVCEVVETMDPIDREVLRLRHFEQRSNTDTARVLGISQSGATGRYVRALRHLKDRLSELDSFHP